MNKKIIIIGGGIAGLSTAIKLKQNGLEVSVFEAGNYNKNIAGEHLGADAKLLFKRLNIPQKIWQNFAIPCTEVRSIWGQSNLHYNESIFNPYGDSILLSRPAFDKSLSTHAESIGVSLNTNSRVSKVSLIDEKWELQIKGQEAIHRADFMIDASGRNSKFYQNFSVEKKDYDGLIGLTKQSEANQNIKVKTSFLLIESTAEGWWYSVQLGNGTYIATFMTDASILQLSSYKQTAFWKNQLAKTQYTKDRIRNTNFPETCFTQSARTHKLSQIAGENWLCVGDAAMAYDPLSSAGIIKGMRMGCEAADRIKERFSGDEQSLAVYDAEHRAQFEEYLEQKTHFYQKEYRWNFYPFWYKRNIRIADIEQFSILPDAAFSVLGTADERASKLDYLIAQSPTIDFSLLLKLIEEEIQIQTVLQNYFKRKNESVLSKSLLQALESMKLIGLIEEVSS